MAKKLDITIADVNEYYSEVGSAILEIVTGSDQFGIGGLEGVTALAQKARFQKDHWVLDVGSGLGGPARYLSRTFGCRVTGLDVSIVNYDKAIQLTRECGLENRIDFRHGSALDMPFKAETFDGVWGMDAWAHVTDKDRLIQECTRVLKRGGTIAFADEIQTAEMDEAERERVFTIQAVPYLETREGYVALLERAGFEVQLKEDVSQEYLQYWGRWQGGILQKQDEITSRFDQEAYDQTREMFEIVVAAARQGKIGEGRFVGRKR
jgi:cyclopropane fatty-acyl-phospholipid synthase-like methyltransferase